MSGLVSRKQSKKLEIGGQNSSANVSLKRKLNSGKQIRRISLIQILKKVKERAKINMASTGKKTGKSIRSQATLDGTNRRLSTPMKTIMELNYSGVSGVRSKETCQ